MKIAAETGKFLGSQMRADRPPRNAYANGECQSDNRQRHPPCRHGPLLILQARMGSDRIILIVTRLLTSKFSARKAWQLHERPVPLPGGIGARRRARN